MKSEKGHWHFNQTYCLAECYTVVCLTCDSYYQVKDNRLFACNAGIWENRRVALLIFKLRTKWLVSRPGHFTLWWNANATHCTGDWLGLRAGVDAWGRGDCLSVSSRPDVNCMSSQQHQSGCFYWKTKYFGVGIDHHKTKKIRPFEGSWNCKNTQNITTMFYVFLQYFSWQ